MDEQLAADRHRELGRPGEVGLRGLAGADVVGGDVVEVAPQYDASTITAQNGAQMAFEILCLVTIARLARRGAAPQP